VWPDPRVADVVEQYVPVRVHVKDAEEYQRLSTQYGAEWTPTMLMLDPGGTERHRVEGFLPASELVPHLEFGAARIAFSGGDHERAEQRFRHVVEAHPESEVAPEALYWAGVSRYKATGDKSALQQTTVAMRTQYPSSPWAKKASVWDPARS